MKETVRFEMMLLELSVIFINLPISKIDKEITNGLRRITKFLKFDRGTLHQISKSGQRTRTTHSWAIDGIDPAPEYAIENYFPWITDFIRNRQKIFQFNSLDEIPVKAKKDRETLEQAGVKSHITIPLVVGDTFVGAFTLATVQSERVISDKIVQRMQLASNILANALIRKQSEIKLQKAFNEIKTLKDQLEAEQTYLREEIKLEYNFDNIIGNSDALKYVLAKVEQVAPTDTTVLVLGETGTGKDLIARSIHEASGRKNKPLIKVDCTSLPANLIESELFGHEKGAFTGAHARKIGKFELANSGTIFLDEIGEMPLELQSKLLRVLQEGNFERIGGTTLITIDVRIIAATNRPLEEEAEKGRFRQDLWYRLNVFPITAPPLRERLEDVPVLVNWFVNKFSKKLGRKLEKIPDAVLEVLQNSSWPGNIRELENVIERAVINSPGSILQLADWNVVNPKITKQLSVRKSLSDVQRQHIRQVLQDVNWKIEGQKGAAAILDLKPSTLRDRMNKLGIKRP